MSHPLIAPCLRMANRCFDEFFQSPNVHDLGFNDRTELLNRVVLTNQPNNVIEGEAKQFLQPAFADAKILVRLAHGVVANRPNPSGLILRSMEAILAPAHLSDNHWNEIKDRHMFSSCPSDQIMIAGPETITFNTSVLADMELGVLPGQPAGCPARGIILNRFFERYVRAVVDGVDIRDHATATVPLQGVPEIPVVG